MSYFSQAGSTVKMAVGFGLLDKYVLNSEVTNTIVYYFVQPVESQLSFQCHNNRCGRHGGAGNYMVIVPRQEVA